MPSGFLAAFSNPGTHWGKRQPCILHKRMQPKMCSTGGKRLGGDVGKDLFDVRDDADDDHSQKLYTVIATYRNIASLHPSLNLHPFTFFFLLNVFSGTFGLVLLALLAGVLEFTLWSEDFSTKEPGNFGDPLNLGQYTEAWYTDIGRMLARQGAAETQYPFGCQSGKAVKSDSITNDVRWYRPPQKWVWMGKLFWRKEKPQTMQDSPALSF